MSKLQKKPPQLDRNFQCFRKNPTGKHAFWWVFDDICTIVVVFCNLLAQFRYFPRL